MIAKAYVVGIDGDALRPIVAGVIGISVALLVLAILYLAIQVFAFGWIAIAQVADVILIFVAAWALAYLLSPLVSRIDIVTPLDRTLSVVLVYIWMGLVLVGVGLLAIPPLVTQLNDLVTRGPEYGERASQLAANIESTLAGLGIRVDLTAFYGTLPQRFGDLAAAYAQRDVLHGLTTDRASGYTVHITVERPR